MKLRKILVTGVLALVVAVPIVASAADIFTIDDIEGSGESLTLLDVVLFVEDVANALIAIATIAVVGMIIYAGSKMATARGDDAEYKKGKEMLRQAIIGGIIIFGVGVIVNTIASFGESPTQILR